MGASQFQAVAPLFAALLAIPFGERYPLLALSPTQQRRRTLAALLDQFEGLARRQPILLSFEDAHWADATSLELLDLTVERCANCRSLHCSPSDRSSSRRGLVCPTSAPWRSVASPATTLKTWSRG